MKNKLVSIIVPLYNYSKFIADCINSIKNQNYSNYELIVIDDCSIDNSYEIAKKFECKNIKIMKTELNSGYSKAKNKGIIASQGELITCLDADDLLTRKSISCRVQAFLDNDVSMVHANAIDIKGDISLSDCYKINPKKATRTKARIHAQTVMLDRNVHIRYGLYDEELRSRSDKEMWWRLLGKYKSTEESLVKTMFLKKDVAYYRKHAKSMMSMRRKNKSYDKEVTVILNSNYQMRRDEGINTNNTRFLEA